MTLEYLPSQLWGTIGLAVSGFVFIIALWAYKYSLHNDTFFNGYSGWDRIDFQAISIVCGFIGVIIVIFTAFHFGVITT